MTTSVTAAEAKRRFAECLRAAERGRPVVITRNGRPVAALVSAEEMAPRKRRRGLEPRTGLATLAGGWEGSEELVRTLLRIRRTRSRSAPRLTSR